MMVMVMKLIYTVVSRAWLKQPQNPLWHDGDEDKDDGHGDETNI